MATGSSTLRSSVPPSTRGVGGLPAAALTIRGSHTAASRTRNRPAKRAGAAGLAIVSSVETLQPAVAAAVATVAGTQIPQTAQAAVRVNWSGKSERLEEKPWCGRIAAFISVKNAALVCKMVPTLDLVGSVLYHPNAELRKRSSMYVAKRGG